MPEVILCKHCHHELIHTDANGELTCPFCIGAPDNSVPEVRVVPTLATCACCQTSTARYDGARGKWKFRGAWLRVLPFLKMETNGLWFFCGCAMSDEQDWISEYHQKLAKRKEATV